MNAVQHGHYLRYPEDVCRDFSRDTLKAWLSDTAKRMAPEIIARAQAEYAKTPYSYVQQFDVEGFDIEAALEQALSDATFPIWQELE